MEEERKVPTIDVKPKSEVPRRGKSKPAPSVVETKEEHRMTEKRQAALKKAREVQKLKREMKMKNETHMSEHLQNVNSQLARMSQQIAELEQHKTTHSEHIAELKRILNRTATVKKPDPDHVPPPPARVASDQVNPPESFKPKVYPQTLPGQKPQLEHKRPDPPPISRAVPLLELPLGKVPSTYSSSLRDGYVSF